MSKRVAIIDCSIANVFSVASALQTLEYSYEILATPVEASKFDAFILPGVGAFPEGMKRLIATGWEKAIQAEITQKKKPLLGICLGMQLLAKDSDEGHLCKGLGLIDANVRRLNIDKSFKVPHVGWNDVKIQQTGMLFTRSKTGASFYYDHSYEMICNNPDDVLAVCDYGKPVVSAIQNKNVCGVQFHPEKSQIDGLKLMRSFFVEAKFRG